MVIEFEDQVYTLSLALKNLKLNWKYFKERLILLQIRGYYHVRSDFKRPEKKNGTTLLKISE